jgi:nicotinate phosphoribosyltransferase
MAFPDEEAAFQAYADIYPDRVIFLIDTYDTLKSGIHNAVKVGKKLALKGKNFGVRLDSGDIHYLSVEVRRILDKEGLRNATISVSNDLDEYIVQTLTNAGAPIDVWGVGTQMVTGGNEAAFTGVYKLAARDSEKGHLESVMKFSDNPEKTTNPGVKQVWRISDGQGMLVADILALDVEGTVERIEEGKTYTFWHPSADYRNFSHTVDGKVRPLLQKRLEGGNLIDGAVSPLAEIRNTVQQELGSLDHSYKRFLNPHIYKVSITEALRDLKLDLIKRHIRSY